LLLFKPKGDFNKMFLKIIEKLIKNKKMQEIHQIFAEMHREITNLSNCFELKSDCLEFLENMRVLEIWDTLNKYLLPPKFVVDHRIMPIKEPISVAAIPTYQKQSQETKKILISHKQFRFTNLKLIKLKNDIDSFRNDSKISQYYSALKRRLESFKQPPITH